MIPETFHISDLEATHRFGCALGKAVESGDVVALIGPLGSGKTTMVKGVADGAGVADLRLVNSPTFVLVNEYEGTAGEEPLHLFHLDAYRLNSSDDLEAIGFDDMLHWGAVLIEWADRVPEAMPTDHLAIDLTPVDANRREFRCRAQGSRADAILQQIRTSFCD